MDNQGVLWKLQWFRKLGYQMRDWQQVVHFSPARHRVIVAGRRAGKSVCAAREATSLFASDLSFSRRVWIVTPTYDGTEKVFRIIRKDLKVAQSIPPKFIASQSLNRTPYYIKTINDGFIMGKSADKPDFRDSLIGEEIDLLIVDEVSKIRGFRYIWQELLRPTLSSREGRAVFISTPRGYDFLYELFKRGREEYQEQQWASWQISSVPYLPAVEIAEARRDLTVEAFTQEYEAKFTTRAGRVYSLFDDQPPWVFLDEVDPRNYVQCIMGVDRGFATPTAITVHLQNSDGGWDQVDEVYAPGMLFEDVLSYIIKLRDRWPVTQIYYAPEQAEEIYKLQKKYRFPVVAANRRDKVTAQIDYMASLLKISQQLGRPMDRVHQRCVKTRWEFDRYSWKERRSTELDYKDEVEKIDDHAMDARRYAIYSYTHRTPLRVI
ncbi:MAG: terminase large subunit domain-containing protein [Candidatus Heimdallarchaeaceae archaeon]